MSCTCIEDKEVIGNVIIGRNKVTCQECIENSRMQDKQRRKQELLGQIADIERKIYYSQLDGDQVWVDSKMATRRALKEELKGL